MAGTATASAQKLMRDGETDKAASFISGLDPQQRAYVVLNSVGDGAVEGHPSDDPGPEDLRCVRCRVWRSISSRGM